ncbi:hypothetical protein EVAR_42622_1 [Eumeta japonica]|uniref:Uncharacterized protein n=1 Tax=Eumeta variegata TaxID=151549 RepID=A0A4C1WV93_EUMVA|nr:hypothetical protein EVAR_42622_1 [Eumeta japonica]
MPDYGSCTYRNCKFNRYRPAWPAPSGHRTTLCRGCYYAAWRKSLKLPSPRTIPKNTFDDQCRKNGRGGSYKGQKPRSVSALVFREAGGRRLTGPRPPAPRPVRGPLLSSIAPPAGPLSARRFTFLC